MMNPDPLAYLQEVQNELSDAERAEICAGAKKATETYLVALRYACIDAGIHADSAELTRFAANIFTMSIQGQAVRLAERKALALFEDSRPQPNKPPRA